MCVALALLQILQTEGVHTAPYQAAHSCRHLTINDAIVARLYPLHPS